MSTSEEIIKSSTIEPYKGLVYSGTLNFSHPRVKGVAEYCMKLFIDAPVPHFMSTFMYFYLKRPRQENPVTCSAYGNTLNVHPGQGRVISAYLRGDKDIDALLIPLNNTQEETDLLFEVSSSMNAYKDTVYSYKNQNHTGISTKKFEYYFNPTAVRIHYEQEKQALLDQKLKKKYPIEFMFNDRKSIVVGKTKKNRLIETRVFCKNPQGLFEYLAFCGDGKFSDSENYKII